MNHGDEPQHWIDELLDATDWEKEDPALEAFAEDSLNGYCKAEEPRLGQSAKPYVAAARAALRARGEYYARKYSWLSIVELVRLVIAELVDEHEAMVVRVVDRMPDDVRDDVFKRVTAWAVSHYQRVEIAGMTMQEHVSDAYIQLCLRARHYPADVSVVAFLIRSVQSNISHLLESAANGPEMLSIVDAGEIAADEPRAGTCTEEELPADDGRTHAQEIEAADLLARFCASLNDEELELYALLRVTNEGLTAKELADLMGTSEDKIRLLHRRLLRRRALWNDSGRGLAF